ncbi:MAG: hypothetical protein ACTTH5_07065 [Wolinella sp.]
MKSAREPVHFLKFARIVSFGAQNEALEKWVLDRENAGIVQEFRLGL